MKKIGFLGCGKIGRVVLEHAQKAGCKIAFIQDPFVQEMGDIPCIVKPAPALYAEADLVVECSTADALKESFDALIAECDLLVFSLTAFSDATFAAHAEAAARASGHHIYFPHGAILGLDGIRDAREIIQQASIETIKSPASLGLTLNERKVVFDGTTRDACVAFPRNVNVHAAVALAGIGFDRTHSRIIADPAATTNAHTISIEGDGIRFTIAIDAFTTGGVTGVYTPLSACGSLDRILQHQQAFIFV